MESKEERGKTIRKIRESKRLSQREFGKMLGITQGGYFRIESGHSDISITRLLQIAEALGVHYSVIIECDFDSDFEGMEERLSKVEEFIDEIENRVKNLEWIREQTQVIIKKG